MSATAGPRKRVLLAAPRGFCAGVDRAVATVERALDQYGVPIYVRKQIVHNKHVVQTLEKKGAIFVDKTEEVPEGSIMIFSAHGVAPAVHDEAERGKIATIDATCPLVTKVHNEAARFASEDYDILLIGQEGHDEVVGTMGVAPDRIHLVDDAQDVKSIRVRDESKVVWLSQTTLSVDEAMASVDQLKEHFPLLASPPSDDICYAAQNRQAAVRQIAPECDLLIVVGSKNSHNSTRLVEVGLEYGARAAHLVDSADEIDDAWLKTATVVGLTSGASVPEILIEGVLDWLSEHGYNSTETVRTATETQHFALPREFTRARTRTELLDPPRSKETSVSADTEV
ncbi:4-hydroxy-3-methylbut-2-enyl diphosphate reductase [Streptomyces sp. NPDC056534]|uniref:4-hydroxy-3-methylbut-2-enyl diphosphate reductase n=1 Tax=Streptomyces sp. NPDC056534 TaxID=3345857 RepID=UPI0036B9C46B